MAVRQVAGDVFQVCPVLPLLAATQPCYAVNVRTGSVLPMTDTVSPYMVDAPAVLRAPPGAALVAGAADWAKVGYVTLAGGKRGGGGGGKDDDLPRSMNMWARRSQRGRGRERYDYRVQDGSVYMDVRSGWLASGDPVHVPRYGEYVVTLYPEFESLVY